MVRYFSSDEVNTPQEIVPCNICSVGNVIHSVIVELLIVSDNKVKNKKYNTIRTVSKSTRKTKNTTLSEQFQNLLEKQKIQHYQNSSKSQYTKHRGKRQNPYHNKQNMTTHSPLTLQFYIICSLSLS